MSGRITAATTLRVLLQIRHDPRTIALVSGVTMVRNATPEQMKRVLAVALDGLRYGAPGSELTEAGTGMPSRRSGAGRGAP